jgi:adenylate cyclase
MADEGFKRKLAAILSADVVGYSRLMRADEAATVRDLAAHRVLINEIIKQHNGRIVDSPGDNILAEFASVVDAVNGAIKIQDEIKKSNSGVPKDRRMEFRIGINLGDVIEEDERIYGDGVNIAARVEGLAAGGGIAISGTVYEHIKDKLSLGYHYLGEQDVKNIPEPVRVYRLLTETADVGKMIGEKKPKSNKLLWAAAAAVVLIILSVCIITIKNYYFRPSFEPASEEKMAFPLPEKPSIAVLPFDNMSGDPEQDYFSDGLSEEIITALSSVPELFVIARNSTFTYKGKPVKVQQISEELGVQYVLEGSVRKSGEKVRITAQLIDALKGHHLWAESYDRNIEDLFVVQEEISMKIITELQVELTGREGNRLRAPCSENLRAYLKFLKALGHSNRFTKEDIDAAKRLAEEAIALDPEYACAYSLLGATYFQDVMLGASRSRKHSIAKAKELIDRAITLNPSLAGPHALLSRVFILARQYDKAISTAKKAIELDPNSAMAHNAMGSALVSVGQSEDSLPFLKQAVRLDPYSTIYYTSLGFSYFLIGKYNEAIHECKKAANINPKNLYAQLCLASTYSAAGYEKEASAAATEILRINPRFSVEYFSKMSSFQKADKELFISSLRKAGLPGHPPLKLSDKPSIAVLPFVNMSGDQEQEYFSDGISEEIITALSKTQLGVRYVLEGSVRKAGDKVRITAQLIDATTEKHLWAERYDRNLREIFTIQDEITLAIIKAMQVKLTKGEMADLTGRGTKNLDAYLKALQAQEQWQRSDKQGTLKAKQLALEAIAIDEQYGWPYAIVSWSHMMDKWLQSSESPKESMRLAAEAIQKALTLDESDHRIHIVLSNLYTMQGKKDEAIASAQRALELCPGSALAHAVLGTALRFACRFSEAVQFREQAIKLDPFPTALEFRNLAVAYSKVGRYEDAIAEYKKALQANPNAWAVYFGLVDSYTKLNRKEEARIAAKGLLRIRPDFSLDWLTETIVPMYAEECRSMINDDIEFLRKADVGLQ